MHKVNLRVFINFSPNIIRDTKVTTSLTTKILILFIIALFVMTLIFLTLFLTAQNGVEYTRLRYRPLIGGIQIWSTIRYNQSLIVYTNCTIGYTVIENSTGSVGVISAGHCSEFLTVPNVDIYQPDNSLSNNYIGGPTFTNRSSDMLFIPYGNSVSYILYYDNYTGNAYQVSVIDIVKYNSVYYTTNIMGGQLPIYKTGRTTGTTYGSIYYARDYCTIYGNLTGPYNVSYCLLAYLLSMPGDSGSPLYFEGYIEGIGDRAWLYGHVVAANWTLNPPLTIAVAVDGVLGSGYTPLTGG